MAAEVGVGSFEIRFHDAAEALAVFPGNHPQSPLVHYGIKRNDTDSRRSEPLSPKARHSQDGLLHALFASGELLDFVEYIVWLVSDENAAEGDYYDLDQAEALEEVLERNGSKWRVGVRNGHAGLEERVPQGVIDVAEDVMRTPGPAGELLSVCG